MLFDGAIAMLAQAYLRPPEDASWIHTIDPVAFELPVVGLPIRWYGLSYVCGFVAAWLLMRLMIARGMLRLPAERLEGFIAALVIGVIVGGRLGYVLFYNPSLLVDFGGGFPFWGALRINQGGMASHGGMIGVLVALFIYARRAKLPAWHLADAVALTAPVGLLFGRLANFINGELLGRVAAMPGEPGPWWAVRYPQELTERPAEVFGDFDNAGNFMQGTLSGDRLDFFDTFAREQVLPTLDQAQQSAITTPGLRLEAAQTMTALLRQGSDGAEALSYYVLSARHPSQLYQACAEGLVLLTVLWVIAHKKRRAGVLSAWFLIVYGLGRITTEFWRLPDAHLAVARFAGLSRGQWLSTVMVVAGVMLVVWQMRQQSPAHTGGWGQSTTAHKRTPPAATSGRATGNGDVPD